MAGYGQFPLMLAGSALEKGLKVYAVAYLGETDPGLSDLVEDILWVKIGQLQRTIDFFTKHGVNQAVMAGGLTKKNLYENFEPDARARSLLAGLMNFSDDGVLRALADEYDSEGVTIRPSTLLAPHLLVPEGVLTQRGPNEEEKADIEFGWQVAKALGKLDVGQLVVVRKLVVLALEAIEGSDEAIRRGGRLGREKAVVIKVCKPHQDVRFDLPSVGRGTIEVMKEVQAAVLAVEAGRTLIFDREEMIEAADRAGIAVVAKKGE
ncbi:MAG: UDP-2,3-diacylglucosamine diphosphatase LpxI [Pseudomonadota bacterium]